MTIVTEPPSFAVTIGIIVFAFFVACKRVWEWFVVPWAKGVLAHLRAGVSA